MKEILLEKLKSIEEQERVKILYAVESGSRAWGFASEDSDYDCRFIYKRSLKDYLTIGKPKRDVIELPVENNLDITGWDLIKVLGLLGKSNPPLMEWLFSPIVYLEEGTLAEKMRGYSVKHNSNRASAYHYLHMAEGNYKDYIKDKEGVLRKKYLYVLRPLVCIEWIKLNRRPPPVRFMKVVESISLDKDVCKAIERLFEEKVRGDELGTGPHDSVLDCYILSALGRFNRFVSVAGVNSPDYNGLDKIFHEEILE